MARPRLGDGNTERVHLVITDEEIQTIETWRYKNRVPSKSEAIRRLCQIGLAFDRDAKTLMQRTERALKATLMMLDKIDKAEIAAMPKGIRGGLAIALEEQIAANRAALSTVAAKSIFADGSDTSEMDNLIARAEGYKEILVNGAGTK